ncbi:MAG: hypothetical protein H8E73_09420, partial [Planctomycetes bacterium]|nr:hypothetical protein [Planctomycetota bacterium]
MKEAVASACARAGREPEKVKLVIVTKSADIEAVKEVIGLGFTELGENRVQQLKKVHAQVLNFLQQSNGGPAVAKQVSWHLIGHLQRNKVRQALPLATLV